MKDVVKVTSVLCGIMALVSAIFGVRLVTGHGFYIGIGMFAMARSGTMMGYIGNILGIAFTVIGFGLMAYFGFDSFRAQQAKKKAFVWGVVMSGICLLSLICSIFAGTFNFGDMLLLALPAIYTFALLKTV